MKVDCNPSSAESSTEQKRKGPEKLISQALCFGGAKRDRTADLLNAIQALSQLSYGPKLRRCTRTP